MKRKVVNDSYDNPKRAFNIFNKTAGFRTEYPKSYAWKIKFPSADYLSHRFLVKEHIESVL